ncbi:MAG: cytochrome c biogenesis protein CcsA, partial [Rhodospirillales bacterium]|nr:cytochrome c biogenesis protein CcsA [Rhodospirillales bacterium]
PEDLARAASQGMNAHLIRVWMAFHPPQIFAAYILFLAPAGAALEALFTGRGPWRELAAVYLRVGWLVLSLGLATGMWWAYEDFTFGQIWHWDPVQTSVFMVWALATAQMHCLRRYRPGGGFAVIHPVLGLLCGAAALASMAVTRSPALASSHRYVGETSLPLWLAAAGLLFALALAGAAVARRRRPRPAALRDGGNRTGARSVFRALRAPLILRQAQDEVPYLQKTTGLMLSLSKHEEPPPFAKLRARAASRTMAIENRYMRLPSPRDEGTILIWCAIVLFGLAALVAAVFIGQAYVSAALALPRPESLKPFFETLARWGRPGELEELRRVFARWDIDGFGMNRWLAPLAVLLGLIAGHTFLALRRRLACWAATALAALLAALSALWLHPMAALFQGTGMTSRQTVAIFSWLDALLVAIAYAILGALFWSARALLRRRAEGGGLRTAVPLGAVHAGVMMALLAGTGATVFDSYAQKILEYPEDFGRPQRFPDGFTVTLWLGEAAFVDDGGPSRKGAGAFRSVAEVAWQLEGDEGVVERRAGHTVYRDDRPPSSDGQGPVRLMCEIVDYRYARSVGGPRRMIHPFIHRGLWRDVQVWFPAVDYRVDGTGAPGEGVAAARQASEVPVVLKVFPLLSWVWIGLALCLGGAAVLTFQELRGRRRVQPDRAPVPLGQTPVGQP